MFKRLVAVFICIVLLVSVLVSCSEKHEDWQTVYFENVGTMKIPEGWESYYKDGLYYIVDGSGAPVFVQIKEFEKETSDEFHTYKYIESLTSAVLSNDPIYGKAKVLYENVKIELIYINLSSEPHFEMLVWDTDLSINDVVEILKTFSSYRVL